LSCARGLAGALSARSFYATGQADKRNSFLLGRARHCRRIRPDLHQRIL